MRQIKFRAFWRDTLKPVLDFNDEYLINACNDSLLFIVDQFTGLTDKNGKDIYENDVLKVEIKHGFNSELMDEFKNLKNLDSINGIALHFIGIVRIDLLRGLMFENIENGYQEPMFTRNIDTKQNHSGIEVIGNIHQNKDLL